MTTRIEPDGDITLIVDGQPVLRISEVNDDNVINLFLYPLGGAGIQSANNDLTDGNSEWTHELLANRKEKPSDN